MASLYGISDEEYIHLTYGKSAEEYVLESYHHCSREIKEYLLTMAMADYYDITVTAQEVNQTCEARGYRFDDLNETDKAYFLFLMTKEKLLQTWGK